MNWLAPLGDRLLDLFFPPRCAGCGRIGSSFCPHCAQAVAPVVEPICAHCGRPQPVAVDRCPGCRSGSRDALALVRVAAVYAEPLRSAIRNLKYANQPELAVPLARYLIAVGQRSPWTEILSHVDGVLAVPLHGERLAERGYNQSGLLAARAAEGLGLAYADALLIRARHTRSQTHLSAQERQENVADAFVADAAVRGKRLLLIDDVFTTGATLNACATALAKAGADTVYGLALATSPFSTGEIPADV